MMWHVVPDCPTFQNEEKKVDTAEAQSDGGRLGDLEEHRKFPHLKTSADHVWAHCELERVHLVKEMYYF